ncbi:hypothetical protein KW791_02460 [Candidatus Parcubacteria bacterium]|nr:hypothetical protein [Candidatus Parcubacteria bacterium]
MEKLTVLGGSDRSHLIGGQSFLFDYNGKRIIIDCGLGLDQEESVPPLFSPLQSGPKIIGGLATHDHTDHISAFPYLEKLQCFDEGARLMASPQTAHGSYEVLYNGLNHNHGYSGFDWLAMPRFEAIEAPGEFELGGLKIFCIPNGHKLGSCLYIIKTPSGRKGMIWGDWCNQDQASACGMVPLDDWPDEWLPDEIWGSDFTYAGEGMKVKVPYADEEERMVVEVVRMILDGIFVRIATFANGKMPNVAIPLARALKQYGIPCYIDSTLGKNLWRVGNEYRWSERDIQLPAFGEESNIFPVYRKLREDLLNSSEPNVVVASAGFGHVGPIVDYLIKGLSRSDHFFASTSWLPSWSPMYQLKNHGHSGKEISLSFKQSEERVTLPVCAGIGHYSLSSHNSPIDTILFLQKLIERRGEKLRRFVVTHGTKDSMLLAKDLVKEFVHDPEDNVIIGYPGTEIPIV